MTTAPRLRRHKQGELGSPHNPLRRPRTTSLSKTTDTKTSPPPTGQDSCRRAAKIVDADQTCRGQVCCRLQAWPKYLPRACAREVRHSPMDKLASRQANTHPSDHRDRPGRTSAQPLPRQARHQPVELLGGERARACRVHRPGKAPGLQPPRAQPHPCRPRWPAGPTLREAQSVLRTLCVHTQPTPSYTRPCRPRQPAGLALRQAQAVLRTPCVRAQPSTGRHGGWRTRRPSAAARRR